MRVKVIKITQFLMESYLVEDAYYDEAFVYSMICYDPSENERLHFYLDDRVEGDYKVIMEGDYVILELNDDDSVKSIYLDDNKDCFQFGY